MRPREGMKMGICYPLYVKEEQFKFQKKKQDAMTEQKEVKDRLPGRCC